MAKEKTEVTPTGEEATEEVVTPPETETQEDLQARLDAAEAERERYENLYKDSQRKESKLAKKEQELDVLGTIPSLAQRLDGIEEYNAMMADYFEEMRGTSSIEAPPTRRSHLDELKQKREQAGKVEKPKPETQVDPEELRASIIAQEVIEDMGWNMETPAVKKTLHLDSPIKALEILKKEQKTQQDREVEERYQAKLKESGVTTPETAGPSGQGTRSFTPAQIRAMSYEEYMENKENIDKAYRAGNIK